MPDFTESRIRSLEAMLDTANGEIYRLERARQIAVEHADRLSRERDVLETELREAQRLLKALIAGMAAEGITLKVAS